MINISECNKNADLIDSAILKIKTLITNYEEAIYYVNKSDSNDSRTTRKNIEDQIHNLEIEKNKLSKISEYIRVKAKEIYTKELEEQESNRKMEEYNTIITDSPNYSNN